MWSQKPCLNRTFLCDTHRPDLGLYVDMIYGYGKSTWASVRPSEVGMKGGGVGLGRGSTIPGVTVAGGGGGGWTHSRLSRRPPVTTWGGGGAAPYLTLFSV